MTPTNNPSSSPSATPTASPTYPCFASEAGGIREGEGGPCYPLGQGQTCVLFDAIHDYYLQDCESNSTCEIGLEWGHPIGSWCVGSVVNMYNLFHSPLLPNNITWDLSGWDTSSVTNMEYMFYALSFNGNLPWNTSSVTKMFQMFRGASSFNGNLSLWDTSSVTNMKYMFYDAESFNGDLSQWDTSFVTDMTGMFYGAESFNGDLFWDVSSVRNMDQMFYYASSFNSSSISYWNVSSVTDMDRMFQYATDFAQDLCSWEDAPAVETGSNKVYQGTWQMFTDSLGQPNDGSGGFNATACN